MYLDIHLIKDSILTGSRHLKWLILVLGFLITNGIEYALLVWPYATQYQDLQKKEFVLRQVFETKQKQLIPNAVLNLQIQKLQSYYKNLWNIFISQESTPSLLEHLSRIALNRHLSIESLMPLSEKSRNFYVEQPIRFSVVGHHNEIMLFLSDIVQLSQVIGWHDFEIKPVLQEATGEDVLSLNMTLNVYRAMGRPIEK